MKNPSLKSNVIAGLLKAGLATSICAFFFACGEDSTTEKIVEVASGGTTVVSSVSELPKCEKENEGEQAFVKGETTARICVDGKWFAMRESVKDTVVLSGDTVYMEGGDFRCKTEELKDGSGLKIVCNGDSIGVVKNGAKGEAGKNGVDGQSGASADGCEIAQEGASMTITCNGETMRFIIDADGNVSVDTTAVDSEKVAISLDTLAGVSQKGPFLKGSTVYLYELSDGRTLKQTNGNFVSNITSDDGRFRFTTRDLMSQYALIMVDGKYRNEVTGSPTNTAIRLQAYTDVLSRKNANVNLLTHLEMNRVYYLVTRAKKRFKVAKHQAQMEIFDAFRFDTTGINKSSEDLNVFGNTDADAALLAISVLLQGGDDETALSVLLTEMAEDLESDGVWNDSVTRARIADWGITADSALNVARSKFVEIRDHVGGWKLSDSVPHFERLARPFCGTELGLGACGKDVSMGIVKHVSNRNSKYYAESYTDTAQKVRFKCSFQGGDLNARWVMATDIEKDTMGWGTEFSTGDVRNGQVNPHFTYVFEKAAPSYWRLGTVLDSIFVKHYGGSACIKDDTTTFRYNNKFYACKSFGGLRAWYPVESQKYNDTQDSLAECQKGKSGRYGEGAILSGYLNPSNKYVCDADSFRLATPTELNWNRGCVSYIHGTSVMFDGQYSYYKCSESGWTYDFDKLNKDSITYEGQTYKTIGIGMQKWMAENLNYNVEGQSSCYNNSPDSCAKYGRLYTWVAAVGKSEEECGSGKNCKFTGTVRGICPEGWHLPSSNEWVALYYAIDSSPYGIQANGVANWPDATDAYGFTALPAGYYNGEGTFGGVGSNVSFWSSTEYGSDVAYGLHLSSNSVNSSIGLTKYCRNPVRCVMDAPAAP